MTPSLNPVATHQLPSFITAPGNTDVLMVVMALFLFGGAVLFGILFFKLHSLPERMAHKSHKLQLEIVAVLCLISLFTHIHLFWIAALLLALVDIPNFGDPLNRIAGSAEKIAGITSAPEALQMTKRLLNETVGEQLLSQLAAGAAMSRRQPHHRSRRRRPGRVQGEAPRAERPVRKRP